MHTYVFSCVPTVRRKENLFIPVKIEKLQRRHIEITGILLKLELWKLTSKELLPTFTILPSYNDVMHINNVYYTMKLHHKRHSEIGHLSNEDTACYM